MKMIFSLRLSAFAVRFQKCPVLKSHKGYFMSTTIQMRKNGAITIPKPIRKKHAWDENGAFTLLDLELDLDVGIFISPKKSVLPSW